MLNLKYLVLNSNTDKCDKLEANLIRKCVTRFVQIIIEYNLKVKFIQQNKK